MRKKVLITGILGYIGSELAHRLLPDEYEVIGIDNAFFPERVQWLHDYDIKFYQCSLLDSKEFLKDIDIIFHLAGITTVPQTLAQSTPEKDAEIYKIGTEGTRYLIENIPKNAKFIFTSTHCIFEGIEGIFNVNEELKPRPILAYAKSKYQSEQDLINSDLDFTIVRLASVFGMGASTMRWKIVANLFSKLSAIDKKIKIFGADSLKPLVGLYDVARCLEFIVRRDFKREIFHVVNDHKTVKELAEICKKFVPDVKLEYSDEQPVGQGYVFSSDKILKTGFRFIQDLELSIDEMISAWKNK